MSAPTTTTTTDALLLLLRQEAYGLAARLFEAMLDHPDAARLARLKRIEWRAERRYWRRHRKAYPPGNRTPPWLYRGAKGGY